MSEAVCRCGIGQPIAAPLAGLDAPARLAVLARSAGRTFRSVIWDHNDLLDLVDPIHTETGECGPATVAMPRTAATTGMRGGRLTVLRALMFTYAGPGLGTHPLPEPHKRARVTVTPCVRTARGRLPQLAWVVDGPGVYLPDITTIDSDPTLAGDLAELLSDERAVDLLRESLEHEPRTMTVTQVRNHLDAIRGALA